MDDRWSERQRYWARKLGRLRLGAEPVEEQVARYRRVTWVLTAVDAGLALIFVGLFAVFGRADVGAILVLVLLAPPVGLAWLEHLVLSARAKRYLREWAEHEHQQLS